MKILYVTTVSMTMGFFPEHIKMLLNEGHIVEIATNCEKPVPEIYNSLGCKVHDIPFSRSPFSKNNLKAYKMLKQLVETEHYDIVHTHTPNASMIDDYIIQPFIEGTEFTIDAFCDFKGNPIFITPRERVAVRSGEVLKIRIAQDDIMIAECKQLLADYRPSGAITVQLIKQSSTGNNYYIEINPRFGGGAPLSIKAGADSAKACIELLMGKMVEYHPKAAKDNAVYCRFDQSICVSEDYALIVVNSLNEVESNLVGIQAFIFDLDDTLYGEKEYIKSGFDAVVAKHPEIDMLSKKLCNAFENGKLAFDEVLGYNNALKKECLSIYRNHAPNIHFYDGAESLIKKLREKNIKIGIITDGRPEGQRAKIAALDLENLVDEIIVTDDLGGAQFRKSCDIAFRIMQKKMNVSFEKMVYVGDNSKKDFIAPYALGMRSIWFKNVDGLYSK